MYRIENFPPSRSHSLGSYGFSIYLDREFAIKVSTIQQPKNMLMFYNDISIFLRNIEMEDHPSRHMLFYNDSILLTNISVAGNACGLDVEWNNFTDVISGFSEKSHGIYKHLAYHPHNVDGIRQAYALIGVFSEWYSFAYAMMRSIMVVNLQPLK